MLSGEGGSHRVTTLGLILVRKMQPRFGGRCVVLIVGWFNWLLNCNIFSCKAEVFQLSSLQEITGNHFFFPIEKHVLEGKDQLHQYSTSCKKVTWCFVPRPPPGNAYRHHCPKISLELCRIRSGAFLGYGNFYIRLGKWLGHVQWVNQSYQ